MKQNSGRQHNERRRANKCAEAPAPPTDIGIPTGANLFLYVTSEATESCGEVTTAYARSCSYNEQATGGDGRPLSAL